MKENLDDSLYNLTLIILIWIVNISNYFLIKEPQIVFLFHFYPEENYLLPRNTIFILPIAFSFIILYNLFLKRLGVRKDFINRLNTLIFFLALFVAFYFLLINY